MTACTKPPGPFRDALMRKLASAPGGLTSADLAACATTQTSQQRRQALVNTVLNRLQSRGLVVRTGMTRGEWQHGRAVIWELTDTGRRFQQDSEATA
jgi:hypothetical protein